MPKYTPEQIYTAARALLPELDEATRRQAESLLAQAESGQETDLDLLDLLTREESTRQRLRALLQVSKEERLLRGYTPLPGIPDVTPGQVYLCPVEGCDYRYVITEAGERPPRCPKHQVELVGQLL